MALASVIEPGDPGVAGLLGLHSAEEVWEMLLGGPADSAWSRRARETSPEHLVEATERCGARFVIPSDSEWPAAGVPDLAFAEPVQDIGGVPLGLWVSGPGDLARWSANSVAIVGSRAATAYGESVAIDLAAGLAELGVTVLSGGAYGIDAAAHRGAMAVEAGSTVAVVACGVDTDYPPGHRALFERMRREHLLVSELAPGQHPTRRRFLVRNRLIAALTQATVIVEAGLRSGASNTANWASAIGRPLLAVPGSVNSAMSQTPHRLIREQRAILATNCAEVVEVLTPFRPPHEVDPGDRNLRALDSLTTIQSRVREAIPARGGGTAAQIALAAGLEIGPCLAALSELEDRDLVRRDQYGAWLISDRRQNRESRPDLPDSA